MLTTEHSSVPGTGSHSEGGGLLFLGGETVWVMATQLFHESPCSAWGLEEHRDLTLPRVKGLSGEQRGLIGGTGGFHAKGGCLCAGLGAPHSSGS